MKLAVVTGGTRGIGAAISILLQENGFDVIATYNQDKITAETFSSSRKIPVFQLDVSDYGGCELVFDNIERDYGPISVLVANAGITEDAAFHKMTPVQWNSVINVNLNGVFNSIHPLWPRMLDRSFGRIVVISSINAQKGQFGQANYAAAKAGEIGLVKSLSLEGAKKNITVNAICPGYIATDMVRKLPQKVLDKVVAGIPIGRLGNTEEIARAVLFLAQDAAGYITGSTLTINGGQYLT